MPTCQELARNANGYLPNRHSDVSSINLLRKTVRGVIVVPSHSLMRAITTRSFS